MSGGSFDYLFAKDVESMMNNIDLLQSMADSLARLGWANDAAFETQELVLSFRQFNSYASAVIGRLQDVWYKMEYWTSHDMRESDMREALAKYRGNFKK